MCEQNNQLCCNKRLKFISAMCMKTNIITNYIRIGSFNYNYNYATKCTITNYNYNNIDEYIGEQIGGQLCIDRYKIVLGM